MGMIVTMKKATLKMIRLLWAGSNQLRRQCNRVVPRPVNMWVHRLHLDGSTNKSETSNFLQMTILAKPLRTHRNVPLCHQHSLQSWLNNGPGCRAWKERWVGLGLTTGRGSSTLSKNFSLAPVYAQWRHIRRRKVKQKRRVMPQSVYTALLTQQI